MNEAEYVVILTDALGRRWQVYMRTYAEHAEAEAAARLERGRLRARGLGSCTVAVEVEGGAA